MNDMREVILNQADQVIHSLEINKDVKISGDFDSIILTGMGGSGHPGDFLNALSLSKLPLYVHRNYDLPLDYLNHMGLTKPLLIASSFSGNTEESLSAYKYARSKNIPILGSASGGQLKEWCESDDVPFCLVDYDGYQPRHTLFAAMTGIYTALKNSNLADDIDSELVKSAETINKVTPDLENTGKELAQKLKGAVPVYTSSDSLGFAAKNFKIQTNENSKAPAFWNTFPELNHNELVGFSKLNDLSQTCLTKFHIVMLIDDQVHPRVQARMTTTAKLYKKWGADVSSMEIPGDTHLDKLFYTITLGMWTTYYLAREYDIDPVPVDGVEDFKALLKEVAGDM